MSVDIIRTRVPGARHLTGPQPDSGPARGVSSADAGGGGMRGERTAVGSGDSGEGAHPRAEPAGTPTSRRLRAHGDFWPEGSEVSGTLAVVGQRCWVTGLLSAQKVDKWLTLPGGPKTHTHKPLFPGVLDTPPRCTLGSCYTRAHALCGQTPGHHRHGFRNLDVSGRKRTLAVSHFSFLLPCVFYSCLFCLFPPFRFPIFFSSTFFKLLFYFFKLRYS